MSARDSCPPLFNTRLSLEGGRPLCDNAPVRPYLPTEEYASMDSRGQNPTERHRDSRNLTFSQANGFEEIPGPLKLEELPKEARTHIWNVFYIAIAPYEQNYVISAPWEEIFRFIHIHFHNRPLDEWNPRVDLVKADYRDCIETLPFNKVFDLIQFVMRHPECPSEFIDEIKQAFAFSRLAYIIDDSPPPTILPAVTREEGVALLESLKTLQIAGLNGGAEHLRKASGCINRGDWAGSVRESIHAVESVARILASEAKTLEPALKSIEKNRALHPALKSAFNKLYGFTSDEQGIRHALLNGDGPDVGMDEAIFMLGACASFASYLWRKHQANENA